MNTGMSDAFLTALQPLKQVLISEQRFAKLILDSTFIAGGAVTSYLAKRTPKDYDLFFSNEEDCIEVVEALLNSDARTMPLLKKKVLRFEKDTAGTKLMIGMLDCAPEEIDAINSKHSPGVIKFVSRNAITLQNNLQIIFRFVGQPEEVFKTFDFEHCKCYWKSLPTGLTAGKFYIDPKASLAFATKQLVYTQRSRFILSALYRMTKFVRRGWSVPLSTLYALTQDASTIDLTDPKVVESELLGFYGFRLNDLSAVIALSVGDDGRVDPTKLISYLEKL